MQKDSDQWTQAVVVVVSKITEFNTFNVKKCLERNRDTWKAKDYAWKSTIQKTKSGGIQKLIQ